MREKGGEGREGEREEGRGVSNLSEILEPICFVSRLKHFDQELVSVEGLACPTCSTDRRRNKLNQHITKYHTPNITM